MMYRLKELLRVIHGAAYQLCLPLLVRPPAARHQGRVRTLVRIAIIQFLESWQPRIQGKVLDVGVGTWSYPRRLLENGCDYVSVDCFEHENIDMVGDIEHLSALFPEASFDFVICTEVLEHIPRPWEAVRELHSILKPGGTLLLTTPFNFHVHGENRIPDYWRISGEGLRMLLREFGSFEEIDVTPVGHPEFPFCHQVAARKAR